MVAIIIDDGGAGDLADLGEAALHAAKAGEAGAQAGIIHAQFQRHRDGGERVLHIVAAGHGQHEIVNAALAVAGADQHGETVAARDRRHVQPAHIGSGGKAVGDDPPIRHARDQRLHFRVIDAQDRGAIEGHSVDEAFEALLHRFEIAPVIEMFGINVGDDAEGAGQPQEAAVAFIGFHHHPVRRAKAGVGADRIDDAAVDHRGIKPAGIQQCGDHGSRGGLAVGAGNRHAAFQPHQFGQHFGASHHRDALGTRRHHFGIVGLDRGGGDQHGGIGDIVRLLADEDLDALLAQAFDDITFGRIAALHVKAQIGHHLGNAGHADAADADEVDDADIGAETGAEAEIFGSGVHAINPVAMTRLASRCAASGWPAARAAAAASAKPFRSVNHPVKASASCSGVNSC